MKKFFSGESVILRFFRFLTDFFYHAVGVGIFGRIFSSYDKVNDRFAVSAVGRLGTGSGKPRYSIRRNIALAMEKNAVMRALCRFREKMFLCGLRTIGLFLLIVGAYSSVVYWLTEFVWRTGAVSRYNFVCGIIAAVLGILLLFSDLSLGYAMQHGFFFRKFLMKIFDLSDETLKRVPREGTQYYVFAVPFGMVLGAASALFNPLSILVVLLWVVLIFLEVSVPEAGVLLLFICVPFAGFLPSGTLLITVAVVLPLLGYFVKIVRGNRAFHMEVQDLPVLLLCVLFFFSFASFSANGAFGGALRMTLFALVYFLVVNTLVTPGWLARCRIAVVLSGTISAVIGILQFILAVAADLPLSGAACAGFTDPAAFSYFLLLTYPVALYTLAECRKQQRLPVLCAVILMAAGTVLSTVRSSAVAVLVMSVIFLLLYERRFLFVGICGGGVLSVLYAILPTAFRMRLAGLCMEKSTPVPVSHLFAGANNGGIGVGSGASRFLFGLGQGGTEAFSRLFAPDYAVITAQNTAFFAFMLCEYGFFAIASFILFLFFLLQNAFSVLFYERYGRRKCSAICGVCLVAGVLVNAFFHYTWYDPAAMVLFFAVSALVTAQLRQERFRHFRTETSKNDSSSVEYEYYMNE